MNEKSKLLGGSSADPVAVLFDVEQTWKNVNEEKVTVTTATNSASCGYEFEVGKEYLVYGYIQDGAIETTICSRTASLADATEDLSILGVGEIPSQTRSEEEPSNMDGKLLQWNWLVIPLFTIVLLVAWRNRKK